MTVEVRGTTPVRLNSAPARMPSMGERGPAMRMIAAPTEKPRAATFSMPKPAAYRPEGPVTQRDMGLSRPVWTAPRPAIAPSKEFKGNKIAHEAKPFAPAIKQEKGSTNKQLFAGKTYQSNEVFPVKPTKAMQKFEPAGKPQVPAIVDKQPQKLQWPTKHTEQRNVPIKPFMPQVNKEVTRPEVKVINSLPLQYKEKVQTTLVLTRPIESKSQPIVSVTPPTKEKVAVPPVATRPTVHAPEVTNKPKSGMVNSIPEAMKLPQIYTKPTHLPAVERRQPATTEYSKPYSYSRDNMQNDQLPVRAKDTYALASVRVQIGQLEQQAHYIQTMTDVVPIQHVLRYLDMIQVPEWIARTHLEPYFIKIVHLRIRIIHRITIIRERIRLHAPMKPLKWIYEVDKQANEDRVKLATMAAKKLEQENTPITGEKIAEIMPTGPKASFLRSAILRFLPPVKEDGSYKEMLQHVNKMGEVKTADEVEQKMKDVVKWVPAVQMTDQPTTDPVTHEDVERVVNDKSALLEFAKSAL